MTWRTASGQGPFRTPRWQRRLEPARSPEGLATGPTKRILRALRTAVRRGIANAETGLQHSVHGCAARQAAAEDLLSPGSISRIDVLDARADGAVDAHERTPIARLDLGPDGAVAWHRRHILGTPPVPRRPPPAARLSGADRAVTEAVRCRLAHQTDCILVFRAGRGDVSLSGLPASGQPASPAADGRSIYSPGPSSAVATRNTTWTTPTAWPPGRSFACALPRGARSSTSAPATGTSCGGVTAFDARGFEVSGKRWVQPADVQRGEHDRRFYAWPPAMESPADVITCWDVIEHVEDPAAALRIMGAHLKPGGWLFLSTPDAGSWLARILGRRWHYLDPLQHINVFSRRNLAALVEVNGLRVRNARTFGRTYRLSYVLNRLAYLHGNRRLRGSMAAVVKAAGPALRVKLPITLGDVMGMAVQRPVI